MKIAKKTLNTLILEEISLVLEGEDIFGGIQDLAPATSVRRGGGVGIQASE